MKRIFVAIEISDEAGRRVSAYVETLRKEFKHLRVSWEKTETLHLTMKFLGDVDDIQLAKLSKTVQKTSREISNFKLQISETGVFPSSKKARILWLGIFDEKGTLLKINDMLESKCKRIGYSKRKRKFKPHLTIGRIREPHQSKELVENHLENEFEPVELEVSRILIIESKLQPTGSVYSVHSKYYLS